MEREETSEFAMKELMEAAWMTMALEGDLPRVMELTR